MTPEDLQKIRERADVATPGPWRSWPHWMGGMVVGREVADGGQGAIVEVFEPVRANPNEMPDTTFIAHARTDIPALLDHIAALEAEYTARYVKP